MIKYQQNMICSVDPRARLDMPEELKRLGANDKCFYQKVRLELLVLKKKNTEHVYFRGSTWDSKMVAKILPHQCLLYTV